MRQNTRTDVNPTDSHAYRGANEPLDSALSNIFDMLALDGHRCPQSIARALVSLESLLKQRFPAFVSRACPRPTLFELASIFLVHIPADTSDSIESILTRIFEVLVGEPTLARNVQQAVLSLVAAHYGSKLARKLAACELDADLYADVIEHADGTVDLTHRHAMGFAFPVSSRSAFSPIAGYSSARLAARKRVVEWESLLRNNEHFGVLAITLTLPRSPSNWRSYKASPPLDYQGIDARFIDQMRALDMCQLVIGKEIAFKPDHLHVHRHVLSLGPPSSIPAIHRAWDRALWPKLRPDEMPFAYVDVAEVVPVGGHPSPEALFRLTRAMTYAMKGQHLPSPWTIQSLVQWGEFVAEVGLHPRRYSNPKGNIANPHQKLKWRAAPHNEKSESVSEDSADCCLQDAEDLMNSPQAQPQSEFIKKAITGPTGLSVEGTGLVREDSREPDLPLQPSEREPLPPDVEGLTLREQDFRAAMLQPSVDLDRLSRPRAAYIGTLSSYLARRKNPLGDLPYAAVALRQALGAYLTKLCGYITKRRAEQSRRGLPVPRIDFELTAPLLPQITRDQWERLRAARKRKWAGLRTTRRR